MQKLLADYRREIFHNNLQEISGVKFTFREIEVIACILHNRGEKKIGELLSVHYRTISAHVRNIMHKLGCNSKDSIIDTIERSGVLFYFRSFYFQLLIQNLFEKKLKKIHHSINFTVKNCVIHYYNINADKLSLVEQLKEHLKLSNINLALQKFDSNKTHPVDVGVDKIIYFVDEDIPEISEKELSSSLILSSGQNDLLKSKNIDYIDFSERDNYCLSVLRLIANIVKNPSVEKIIEEFVKEYEILEASWKETKIQTSTVSNSESQFTKVSIYHISSKFKKYIFAICGLVMIVSITYYVIKDVGSKHNTQASAYYEEAEKLIATLDNIIIDSSRELSASPIQEGILPGTYAYVSQIEELISPTNKELIEHYFSYPENSTKLAQHMYSLCIAAIFYNHTDYSFDKSIEISNFIKDIIENYLKNLSKVPLDFNSLTKEEMLSELKIVPGIPEVYTKLLYTLGSAHMHLGNLNEAIHYFELSNYLGNELRLLQGPLSERSGLMKIKQHEAFADIKNGNFEIAKNKLLKLIESYRHYKSDPQQFISYSPFRENKIIQLNEDPTNVINNANDICDCYIKLTLLTKDQKQKEEYVKLILNQYLGNNSEIGIFSLLDKINHRKRANVYNELGYNLLQLYDAKISLKHMISKLNQFLEFDETKDLDFIEHVFNLALETSRNAEIEKVVSYKGLITANQERLNNSELNLDKKNELLKLIDELTTKRNSIKQKLGVNGSILGVTPGGFSD